MFSLIKKLGNFLYSNEGSPSSVAIDDYERFLIRECPAMEKAQKTGAVTSISTDHSVVDESIHLDHKFLPVGTKLKMNDKVVMRVFRHFEHESWQVESVDTVFGDFWDTNFSAENEDVEQTENTGGSKSADSGEGFKSQYIGLVTATSWKEITIDNGAYSFSNSDIGCEYTPVVGDWLSLELEEDIHDFSAKPVVKSAQHLRAWNTDGKITQLDEKYGLINQNITFSHRAVVGNFIPKLNDHVQVKCVEYNHAKYQWRAVAVSPMPFKPSRQLPTDVKSRSQFLEELTKNKGDVVIQDVSQLPELSPGDAHELILVVKNTSSNSYKMRAKIVSDNDVSQVEILEPLTEIECTPKSAVRVKFKIRARNLGQSKELCIFCFGAFKIGRVITLSVAEQPVPEKKHASAESIKSMFAARRQRKNPDEIMERVEKIGFKISGERPFKPPMFAPNRLPHFPAPKQLWSAVVYRDKLMEQYPWLGDHLTPTTYAEKLKLLLHLEEIEMTIRIREFDMKRVTFRRAGEFLALEVPGLAEKRPSLMLGDSAIALNPWDEQGPENEGFVHQVTRSEVFLKFHQNFHEGFGGEDYDVSFMFSRTPLRRCHQAVEIAGSHLGFEFLFPRKVIPKRPLINVTDDENNSVVQAPYFVVVKKRAGLSSSPKLVAAPKSNGRKTVAQRLFEKQAAVAFSAMSASKNKVDLALTNHLPDVSCSTEEGEGVKKSSDGDSGETSELVDECGINSVSKDAGNISPVRPHGPRKIKSSPRMDSGEKTEETTNGESDHADECDSTAQSYGCTFPVRTPNGPRKIDYLSPISPNVNLAEVAPSPVGNYLLPIPPNINLAKAAPSPVRNIPKPVLESRIGSQALNSAVFSFSVSKFTSPNINEIRFVSPIVPLKQCQKACDPKQPKIKWFNSHLNKEQRSAVIRICRGEGRPLPYIVYGPPGTGKTVTVVEAVLQIFTLCPHSRILVGTPSNSSADLVTERIAVFGKLQPGSMVRLNSHNRSLDNIPESVLPFTGTCDDVAKVIRHRIIVTTCTTSGQIYTAGVKKGHFTHVFIDEAGQATEPDCLVPLGLVMADVGQVILAGDPQQLGPVVQSNLASTYGLEYSLLERMSKVDLYSRNEAKFGDRGCYDPFLLTKLIRNYRSHEKLVSLPSMLFYDNDLVAYASENVQQLCQADFLPKKGIPLIFHGIRGQNIQENDDPSWFNPAEAYQVVTYLRQVLNAGVAASEIGIITPYRKQVEKIRFAINKFALENVKVGSVEEFQGQERDVIILSTVRCEIDLLEKDLIHSLGFVKSPKRFNVAITRAKSLLVVVGDPHLLRHDENWAALLEYCIELGAYVGCDLPVGYSSLDVV